MSNTDPLEIYAPELEKQLDGAGRNYILVDVRETYELARGVLPGAISIPMSEIEDRRAEIDTDSEVICYCEHGVRSYNVATWLQSKGHKARSLAGGFADWNGPRIPVEK